MGKYPDPTYWSFKRMEQVYPQAFTTQAGREPIGDNNQRLPAGV
jgi:hypothetical protein